MDIQFIDPTCLPSWDEDIRRFPQASFFHGASWAKVLSESYGYRPAYLTLAHAGEMTALLPVMEVTSFITGTRGVSLPFTDYCEALTPNREISNVLLDMIKGEGKKKGWRYIELRGGSEYLGDAPAHDFFYTHKLDLSPGTAQLFKNLRDSTRRNIKKSERAGLHVQFESTLDALKEFYRLNCLTRREHGLPPQPWAFFENVFHHIIRPGDGLVANVLHENKVIASNVYFRFGDTAIYKYGASDKRYQNLRANNLLMWEAIRRYADDGCRQLCFGRTDPWNEGLRQFKTGWGTEEKTIHYYRYDLARHCFLAGSPGTSQISKNIFCRMPLPLARAIGSVLYRHVG